MPYAPAIRQVLVAQSDIDLKDAFASVLSELGWEKNREIPWRDDDSAVKKTMHELSAQGTASIWRTHKAADPFSGVGEDWAHGSFVAFPPNDGAHGLGFGSGIFPPGYSFVTRFSDQIGEDRPVAGDFGLEWIAHSHGTPRLRQLAMDGANSIAALRQKLGDPATSVHEAIGLVYETPVSRDTATVEERLIVRRAADGGFDVFRIPDSEEWNLLLSRMGEFDKVQVSQPRNFGNMPPAAAAGEKCPPVVRILAKMEAVGKGCPLTAAYGTSPELIAIARDENRQLTRDMKVERLLDLTDGSTRHSDPAVVSVDKHEILNVWNAVIERISKKNAANMLDMQDEWKSAYPAEIAGPIIDALQDKVIGVSAVPSLYALRSAVKELMGAPQAPAAPAPARLEASSQMRDQASGSAPTISLAGAQSIGRLRSRLGTVYNEMMRGPDPAVEAEHYAQFEAPSCPQ